MIPYYDEDGITIYHGDWRDVWPGVWPATHPDVVVTDPPYGIDYRSNQFGTLARSIVGDDDTTERDDFLRTWPGPALVFGTWKRPVPTNTRQVLIWDTKGALGMGALDLPWKPAHQQIYVIGKGFRGHRGNDVLRFAPVQSMAYNGRVHPHQKPVDLMRELISKCPDGVMFDPFMGSGSTLRAAKDLGRQAVGIEIDESYCEIAVQRLAQGVFAFGCTCQEGYCDLHNYDDNDAERTVIR